MAAALPSQDLRVPLTTTVCVTGASGFLGSWLVKLLLQRGYNVRATVRNPENKAKTSHLRALTGPGEEKRLEIVKGDLLDESDFEAAVKGCDGVFHVASPVAFESDNPEEDIIQPAVQGTLNVLKACARSPSVRRVIYTSSGSAVTDMGKDVPRNQIFNETCWTSIDFCRHEKPSGWPYIVSKTLAEQTAVKFAKENDIDMVSIVPTLVVGSFLTPEVPSSVAASLALLTGEEKYFQFLGRMSYIHIDDVARAHIFLYEHPEAEGRYICSQSDASIEEVANMLSQRYPQYKVSEGFGDAESHTLHCLSSERLKMLGFEFQYTLEDMFEDSIQNCKQEGLPFQINN